MAEGCGHTHCRCAVPDEGDFCSQHCRQMAATAGESSGCRCGHADCETDEVVELDEE